MDILVKHTCFIPSETLDEWTGPNTEHFFVVDLFTNVLKNHTFQQWTIFEYSPIKMTHLSDPTCSLFGEVGIT